jgi:hypothetical protein
MIDTVALAPAYNPDGVPVTVMSTGNEATLDEAEDATSPTDETVP